MSSSKFNKTTGDKICKLIIDGMSLREIVKKDGMPNRSTVHDWLSKNTLFADQYARACQLRQEHKFEIIEYIADKEEDVQRARLKIDVVKWQLSKEAPKKYGDKVDLTTDGEKLQPILVKFIGDDEPEND